MSEGSFQFTVVRTGAALFDSFVFSMPTLTLVSGLPGAGKTTYARRRESETGAVRLCPDERIDQTLKDPTNAFTFEELRDPTEDAMVEEAKALLTQGKYVILEFGFWGRDERLRMIAMARELNVKVELVLLDPPLEEIWRRLGYRNTNLPAGSFVVSHEQLIEFNAQFQRPDVAEIALYDAYTTEQ